MTEERKQELRRLLEEATAVENLEIRRSRRGVSMPCIDVGTYRALLQQRWVSHSDDTPLVWEIIEPEIINETTKSNLLEFIRDEFAGFIYQDRIQSVCSHISSSPGGGYPLSDLLKQLLKIAIGWGTDRAVTNFDKYSHESEVSVRYMGILEGIRLKTKIPAFDGIELVSLPKSTSELPSCLPTFSANHIGISPAFFIGKTLLIIDYFLSPVFHTPLKESTRRAHFDQTQRTFRRFEYFCQALSLACSSAVQISLKWPFWPEDELFSLASPAPGPPQISAPPGLFAHPTQVDQTHIAEANRLHKILDNNSEIRERLEIPINRWIKSMTREEPIDKIIDLGIAFEAPYLSNISERTELSFRLKLHAAWHLRENEQERNELMKEFTEIYDWRSSVVHSGNLPKKKISKKKKRPYTNQEVAAFIQNAQILCRESILKIIEDGEIPKWDSLILGGNS